MSNHIELLKKYNIWAKKSLGQNFLIDDEKVQKIADFCELDTKNIVEVGPGYGALTEKLVEKNPETFTLIELDIDMVNILKDRNLSDKIDIKNIDVLEYSPDFEIYSVIANIPYYITSPILRHFLYEVKNKPQQMLILMQQDVGDKILGKGKNKSSVLSLFIEKKCSVKEVLFVPKECFHPSPKVESSVLHFEIHNNYKDIDDEVFLKIIKAGFSSPRKKLIKNFENAGYHKSKVLEIFEKLSIPESVRGEDLSIEQWCELVEKL